MCKAYRRIVIDSTSRPMLEAPGELPNVACDEPLSISEGTVDAPEPESSTEFWADTGGGRIDVATGGESPSGGVPDAACRGRSRTSEEEGQASSGIGTLSELETEAEAGSPIVCCSAVRLAT